MRNQEMAVALAVASVLALSGCFSPVEVPPGPTQQEIDANTASQLDDAWVGLGLPENATRPETPVARVLPDEEWVEELGRCLVDVGVTSWSIGYGPGYFEFMTGSDGSESIAEELRVSSYECLARNSREPVYLMSDAQLEYLWAHYERCLVPCLERHGYPVRNGVSHADFMLSRDGGMVWSPYYSITVRHADEIESLTNFCGDEYGALTISSRISR